VPSLAVNSAIADYGRSFLPGIFILTLLKGVKIRWSSGHQFEGIIKLRLKVMLRYGGVSSITSTLYKDGTRV